MGVAGAILPALVVSAYLANIHRTFWQQRCGRCVTGCKPTGEQGEGGSRHGGDKGDEEAP